MMEAFSNDLNQSHFRIENLQLLQKIEGWEKSKSEYKFKAEQNDYTDN